MGAAFLRPAFGLLGARETMTVGLLGTCLSQPCLLLRLSAVQIPDDTGPASPSVCSAMIPRDGSCTD